MKLGYHTESGYMYIRIKLGVRNIWNWNVDLQTNICLLNKVLQTRFEKARHSSAIVADHLYLPFCQARRANEMLKLTHALLMVY